MHYIYIYIYNSCISYSFEKVVWIKIRKTIFSNLTIAKKHETQSRIISNKFVLFPHINVCIYIQNIYVYIYR